jgi:hypothetical protein
MVYLAVTFYGTRVQRAEFNTDVSLHQHSSISLLRMAIRAVAKFRVIDMQESVHGNIIAVKPTF